MGSSEFDEAYEDDDHAHFDGPSAPLRLDDALRNASIRALDPQPAVTVDEETSIADSIRCMIDQGIGAVLVTRGGRAVGIFTERDVLKRVSSRGSDHGQPVSAVMTPDPECLDLDDGIGFALNRMIEGGFRHVPILDGDGRPVAVLSLREVVAFIVSLLPARMLNLPPAPALEARSTDGG
jgi:CBS domain-containing protein